MLSHERSVHEEPCAKSHWRQFQGTTGHVCSNWTSYFLINHHPCQAGS